MYWLLFLLLNSIQDSRGNAKPKGVGLALNRACAVYTYIWATVAVANTTETKEFALFSGYVGHACYFTLRRWECTELHDEHVCRNHMS